MSAEAPTETITISTNIIRTDPQLKLNVSSLDNEVLIHGGMFVSRINPDHDDVFRGSITHTLAGVMLHAADLQPEIPTAPQALGFNIMPAQVGERVGSLLVPCMARTYQAWVREPRDISLHQFHQKALGRVNDVLSLAQSPYRFSTDFF